MLIDTRFTTDVAIYACKHNTNLMQFDRKLIDIYDWSIDWGDPANPWGPDSWVPVMIVRLRHGVYVQEGHEETGDPPWTHGNWMLWDTYGAAFDAKQVFSGDAEHAVTVLYNAFEEEKRVPNPTDLSYPN